MLDRPDQGKNKRRLLFAGIAASIIVLLLVAGATFYGYTQNQVYHESIEQLDELSDQLFEKLEDKLDLQWSHLDKFAGACTQTDSLTSDELAQIIAKSEKDLAPVGATLKFRALDDQGIYYTSEGEQGSWTGLDNIDDDDDDDDDGKQSFLIANWLDNQTYIAFVINTPQPLTVDGHEITHFILLRSINEMQPYFHSSAFGDNNLTFIIAPSGMVLFEDGELEGIDLQGKNVFYAMEDMELPHAESLDAFIEECKTNGKSCTEIRANGHDFYVVYNYLPGYDWGMLFFVSADDIATTTNKMVNSIMVSLILMFGVLLVLFVIVVATVMRFQNNQKLLAIKTESEEQLGKANALLSESNVKLEESQHKIEMALDEAQRATKAKSNFLANMSHDIRTPMNAIVGLTELMEDDLGNREKMLAYIKKLRTSSNYMLGLINDILDMSKIESGEVSLNQEPLKMAEQAGQIESIIRSHSNERNQTLDVVVHKIAHEYLIGDSIRVRQVFINLLNNATKYTQTGGVIRFEIREIPCDIAGYASFVTSVIDNGCGMSADYLEHLFEPFTREESSLTNKVQGTGLGMSITKSLVDLMGGTITVESELGHGTRFDVTLTLPIDREAYENLPVQSILLICTEQRMIENMEASLSETGINLRVVPDAETAAQRVRESMPEVVLVSGEMNNEGLTNAVSVLRAAAADATGTPAGAALAPAGDANTDASTAHENDAHKKFLVFWCDYAHKEYVSDALRNSGIDGLVARPFFLENLVAAVHSANADENPSTDDRRLPLKNKRFLCAEDNELNAEILEALLAMHNASCVIYPNGAELVEAFASVKPGDFDAILMDMQMPKMDGVEATRAIRASSNTLGRTIPIIAMTANAFSTDVQECLEAGMDAHLAKPLDITSLERTLHEILSKKQGGGTKVR